MPTITTTKKTKISLKDYPFAKDIENRILMSNFTITDLALIQEIIDGSLNRTVEDLADSLDLSYDETLQSLEKLSKTGLLQINGSKVLADKEKRKYFESQIAKFDADFSPGVEYIKGFLKKVPIDVLPQWYQLPRTSDDIFESIIEKFLLTPKIFLRHLDDLFHEAPLYAAIWKELLSAKDFTLKASDISAKYNLSKEAFEELMLHLEFNFIACLQYRKENNQWVEVIKPFAEWEKYITYLQNTKIDQSIDENLIEKEKTKEFIDELTLLLKQLKVKPVKTDALEKATYDRLVQLRLAEVKGEFLHPLEVIDNFLKMNSDQKSHLLHRTSILKQDSNTSFYIEKHLREIERSLSYFTKTGWIYFDDFIKACSACIGTAQEISLKKVGRSWQYALPLYKEEEIAFIKEMIFERLKEAGTVEVGHCNNRPCFRVTAFGDKILSRD